MVLLGLTITHTNKIKFRQQDIYSETNCPLTFNGFICFYATGPCNYYKLFSCASQTVKG